MQNRASHKMMSAIVAIMGDNDDDDYDSVRMNKKLREGEYLASAESG